MLQLIFCFLLLNWRFSCQYIKIEKSKLNYNNGPNSISKLNTIFALATTTAVETNSTEASLSITSDNEPSKSKVGEFENFNHNITINNLETTEFTITEFNISLPSLPKNPKELNKTKKKEDESRKNTLKLSRITNYYCECDLRRYYCNINCCCDIDCNEDMLKTFECDKQETLIQDLKHQTDLHACKVQNGWLCVVQENTNEKPNKKYNPELLYPLQKNQWNFPLSYPNEEQIEINDYYKYQEPLKIYIQQKEKITNFDMPFPLFGSICNVFEPIYHLVDTEYSCLLSIERYYSIIQEIQGKLSTALLINVKKGVTNSLAEHCNNERKPAHCSKFNLLSCPKTYTYLSECKKIENSSNFGGLTFWNKIKVVLHHNYTHLNSSSVIFISEDKENLNHSLINLKIEIKFIFNNMNLTDISEPTGGPLGYKTGLPIIKGNMNLLNESAEEPDKVWILDYFHPNKNKVRIRSTLSLMTSSEGICQKTSKEYPINFGENSIAVCDVNLNISLEIKNNTNYEEICIFLQSTVFHHVLNTKNFSTNYEMYVSEFGIPRNDTKFWTKIQLKNYEPIQILAEYDKYKETFSCKNMILGIKIGFITAKLKINNNHYHNVIKSAFYEFEQRRNLQFRLNETLKFPIYASAMFYDVTDTSKIFKPSKNLILILIIIISFLCINLFI